jgi:uncharacterized protein YhfF
MVELITAEYWNAFLASLSPLSPYYGKPYILERFGDTLQLADELGQLVVSGVKTATSSALWMWEAEGTLLPQPGLLSIILDGKDQPLCIIETTEVYVCRFNAVDEEFARDEGEGDLSLADWRESHKVFFSRHLATIEKKFSEEMPLVCERFRVIYK